MASEVEETLKRLVSHKGVIGTIIVNADGIPIKSTLDSHTTTQYSGLMNQLVDQAKTMFKEIDSSNDLTFMRLRTKKHEIMVAPDRDYLLIVIQNTDSQV
jgi:dynein light chain roadblock-type